MYQRHVSFSEAITLGFSNYFNFRGRAQRSEYWWFILFTLLGSVLLSVLEGLVFGYSPDSAEGGAFSAVFSLLVFIPSLSLGWRRLHDTNRSGLWLLLPYATLIWMVTALVILGLETDGDGGTAIAALAIGGVFVFIGSLIWVIIMLARDSDVSANRYGPSVKYDETAIVFA
jgi:uncharacterized membrane protein YhaH (DUF805 family)